MSSKNYTWIIVVIYSITFLVLALAYMVAESYNIPFEKITGDPANYYNFHPFTGLISNIGALMWCTTACICMFSGLILRKAGYVKEAQFQIFSGLFSIILLFDDFFMFHDNPVLNVLRME